MQQSPLPFDVSHEIKHGVLIQDLTGWEGNPDHAAEFAPVWEEHASSRYVKGAITLLGPDLTLDAELQTHIEEDWGPIADKVGIERLAFVSDGIKSMALSANVDASDCSIDSFNDEDEAFEWVQEVSQT